MISDAFTMSHLHLTLTLRSRRSAFDRASATDDLQVGSATPSPRSNSSSTIKHNDDDHAKSGHGLQNHSNIQEILASIEASQATPSQKIENVFSPRASIPRLPVQEEVFFRRAESAGLTSRVTVPGDISGTPVFVKKIQCMTDEQLEENESCDWETSMTRQEQPASTGIPAGYTDQSRDSEFFPAEKDKTQEDERLPTPLMGKQLKWLSRTFSNMKPESIAIVVQLDVQITAPGSPKGPGLAFPATLERGIPVGELWQHIKDENHAFLQNARLQDNTPKRWIFQLRPTIYEPPHAPLTWSATTRWVNDCSEVDQAWQDFLAACVAQGRESAQRLLDEARLKCGLAVVKLCRAPYNVDGHPRDIPDFNLDTKARVYGKMYIGF